MKSVKRKFISIYFKDGLLNKRKKRDLTIAISSNSFLYNKCDKLTSSLIKKLIGVSSYQDLTKKAAFERRTLGNFVKYKLEQKLIKHNG